MMKAARRFVEDESGMTLALAIMMIVIIGVMGAGLLTFVSGDLNTVTQENRGQKAFEMADAGVAAAKRQLLSDCGSNASCQNNYNDPTDAPVDDLDWSDAQGGLTLNDLDGDGGTLDCVNVKISTTGTYDFKVVSTGYYHSGATGDCEDDADAKRKIEAKLHGETGLGGGSGGPPVNPGYYTPSDILIAGNLNMAGESLFSEQDIIFKGLSPKTRQGFQDAAKDNAFETGDPLGGSNTPDALYDWYSPELPGNQNWNLQRRWKLNAKAPFKVPSDTYDEMGFAAQGKICSPPSSSALTCTDSDPSVADGVFGYDSTTGKSAAEDPTLYPCPEPAKKGDPPPPCATTTPLSYSTHMMFKPKDDPCSVTSCPTPKLIQEEHTISYPFPRVKPSTKRLYDKAQESGNRYWPCTSTVCSPPFTTGADPLFSSSGSPKANKVVFIDAAGHDLTFSSDHGNLYKGVLVVCNGTLTLDAKFTGIIVTLTGDDGTGHSCGNDPSRGRFILAANNQDFSGWMYANGGTGTDTVAGLPGITLENNTKISPLPSGSDDLANVAFGTTTPSTPNNFSVQGWRELYN